METVDEIVCGCGGKLIWDPSARQYKTTIAHAACALCGCAFELVSKGWPHASFSSTGTIAHGEPITLTTDIIVNGKKHTIAGEWISYEKAVELANTRQGADAIHTVVYWCRRTGDERREGSIHRGVPVKAELGMVVTAVVTA